MSQTIERPAWLMSGDFMAADDPFALLAAWLEEATFNCEGAAVLWDVRAGKEIARLPGGGWGNRKGAMRMLAFTPAGRERTLAGFDALFGGAGLTLRRRITLPSLFDVFELVVASG